MIALTESPGGRTIWVNPSFIAAIRDRTDTRTTKSLRGKAEVLLVGGSSDMSPSYGGGHLPLPIYVDETPAQVLAAINARDEQ